MTLRNTIKNLSKSLFLDQDTTRSIDSLIANVSEKAQRYFLHDLHLIGAFGSYSRNTLLPRQMDSRTVIDVMVCLNISSKMASDHLNYLQQFVEHVFPNQNFSRTPRSLTLHFSPYPVRLLPAVASDAAAYRIPARSTAGWLYINPTECMRRLEFADQFNRGMVRPLIRVAKYWNATHDYPFHPFEIEQAIINKGYQYSGGLFSAPDLFDYVYDFLTHPPTMQETLTWKLQAIRRTQIYLERARRLDAGSRKQAAIKCITKVLPPIPTKPTTNIGQVWLGA
ncbi:MAG: hypothetical protein OEW08_00685 [Gammaproteobacteria bacterium]|nr:hypothetical protein [Gammaproteobacteria bacterium]